VTYQDRLNIALCARSRGHHAAANGDRARYYRETAAAFRLIGWHGTAETFDRLEEGEAMTARCVLDYASQPPVFRCLACGATQVVPLPLPITEVVQLSEQFQADHRRCRPTSRTPLAHITPSLQA
jgi:hypothetical protein